MSKVQVDQILHEYAMDTQTHNLPDEYVKPISRGQITIPIAYREAFGIDENTWLRITADQDRIVLYPQKKAEKKLDKSPVIIKAQYNRKKYLKQLLSLKGSFWTDEDEQARLLDRKRHDEKLKKLWGEK